MCILVRFLHSFLAMASLPLFNTIFFKRLTIGKKLIISYLLVGIVILSTSYYFYFDSTQSAIIDRTHNQLSSVMNLKKGWLESYFATQKTYIQHFTTYYSTQFTFTELEQTFSKYGAKSPAYLLTDSLFGHSLYQFMQSNHYKNVWMVSKDGQIIYTSVQNGYLGKNVNDTVFYNPMLKQLFTQSYQNPFMGDLDYVSQINSNPCLVIISPIKDSFGEVLGFILVKFNFDDINSILSQRSGMGETGESYVVSQSYSMRSNSRFISERNAREIMVSTPGVALALAGNSGRGIFKDYRGLEVLSCFSNLKIDSVNWALLSEIDMKEAMLPIYNLNRKMIIVGVLLTNVLVLVTIYLSRKIANPIKKINSKINLLSRGILPDNYLEVKNEDEIGQIANSVNKLVDEFRKTTGFAKEIGAGNFSVVYTPLSNSDVLGFSLLEMRDRLAELSKIVTEQNRLKTISLVEGQENERIRISRELHDGVGQMLTALKFKVQELDSNNTIVLATKHLLDETIQEVRRVAINLVPSVLYDFGIEAAIKILIKNIDLQIEFTVNRGENSVEPDLEKRICLYRITQEALQNIQKYANTDKVRIHIEFADNGIDLIIMDVGIGFNAFQTKQNNHSNGLRNMKERANLVGGTFEIESELNKGTKITVNIPV